MKTKLQKDFLEVRRIKETLLSQIDTMQGDCKIAFELGNNDRGNKLDDAIEYAYNKICKEQQSFEECYELSYNEMETDWLINNKKF